MVFTRGTAKVKMALIIFMSIWLVGGTFVTARAQEAKKDESKQITAGKTIFEEVNCLMCHLLQGKGGGLEGAPDVAGVSKRRDQANMREWLKKHLFEEPRIDMFEEDPTDADIEALVQYLSTL